MQPFDQRFLERLMQEFRISMRALLSDLCRDFGTAYVEEGQWLGLPIEWFRTLAREIPLTAFSHWKIVGWIESLNDLLYFVDVLVQVRHERKKLDIAEQLRTEFQEKFYENSYADEVFPLGKPEPRLLVRRLNVLCRRLARELTHESIWLAPESACRWVGSQRRSAWRLPYDFSANMERVELACSVSVGTEAVSYELPRPLQRLLIRAEMCGELNVRPTGVDVVVGSRVFPAVEYGPQPRWYFRRQDPITLRQTRYGDFLLGPTLVYDRHRVPRAVRSTPSAVAVRIQRALDAIEAAWPVGNDLLALLTSRVCPLRAWGVVSFSYRHRPGLSVINCFDRDNLDLIDDLIHENSHHHLNLLLRKFVMYGGDRNQERFYSPWRRSLRPIRGILHATFTFTMGALLFERLSSWADRAEGRKGWKKAGLTARDLRRARARCLEELESVRYSIQDLEYAGRHLKWLTPSGKGLVKQLELGITAAGERMARHRPAVLKSEFGQDLRRHIKELEQARRTYGPMGLKKV